MLSIIYILDFCGDGKMGKFVILIVTLAACTFCGVSLLTLTAISLDRLLALLLGLRYRQVVTVKKTYIAVLAFWIVSIVGVPAFTAIREYVP